MTNINIKLLQWLCVEAIGGGVATVPFKHDDREGG